MTSKELMALPIQARNEAFDALTMRERAVLVAEDVIAQIEADVYRMHVGSYLSYFRSGLSDFGFSFQERVSALDACAVCAIGATFVSCARLGNQATMDDANSEMGINMVRVLARVFTPRESRAMECILEQTDYSRYSLELDRRDVDDFEGQSLFTPYERERLYVYQSQLMETYSRGYDPDVRSLTIAMMENVIANDGVFVVPDIDLAPQK